MKTKKDIERAFGKDVRVHIDSTPRVHLEIAFQESVTRERIHAVLGTIKNLLYVTIDSTEEDT